MSKIYHVELFEPYDGQQHFYFGSQSAIFDVLTTEIVGIAFRSLSNHHNLTEAPYRNKKCIIRLGTLCRKKTNRGKK